MSRDSYHTEIYKGHEIRIELDEGAENPFEHWDCEPPLAVAHDRDITEYATQYGGVNIAPHLTDAQIVGNLEHINNLIGKAAMVSILQDQQEGCDFNSLVNERIVEAVDDMYNADRLETLCDLYNMIGVPALVKCIYGYSQGDACTVLAVATPEFQKACGNATGYWDDPEKLQPSIDLFKAWCYEDVYGYVISTLNEAGESNDDNIESCWGYYGDYEDNCLAEARAGVDRIVEAAKKSHFEQVKSWIRSKTPLQYREAVKLWT